MLKTHIDSKENVILMNSGVVHNAGHTLNRGTPREIFVRDFLSEHLSEKVAIGTGEIIDSQSLPRQQRNQMDIVVYKREYPKLHLGGGIHAFLAESVVATIEIKSLLDQAALEQSFKAASKTKALQRSLVTSFTAGYHPPSILNYVVAYDGPASMQTVHGWISSCYTSCGITPTPLPTEHEQRMNTASPALDGIYVLGKGFLQYDNVPMSFINDQQRLQNPQNCWFWSNIGSGSLFYLFLQLTQSISGVSSAWLDPSPYVANFQTQVTFTR